MRDDGRQARASEGRTVFNRRAPWALALVMGSGCGGASELAEDAPTGKAESPERIDSQNDPNRFRLSFVSTLTELPASGESTRKPFPHNWWPMSSGGVARRWNAGQPSPAEKYDLLITPDAVRDVRVRLAQRDWRGEPVNMGAAEETLRLGPAAEWEHRNHGRYGEVDPDSWWGHCNGWASYVLNEDEPTRPVTVRLDRATNRVVECASAGEAGCVRFELGDINALGSELYWSDAARMLGRRCEQEASEFNFDPAGRINAVECRDGNAGAFHLVVTNMLGRLQRPFIVDLNADREVWNYPVYRYQVLQSEELTLAQALREVGAPAATTTWEYNTDAVRWVRVQTRAWIVEDAVPPSTRPTGQDLDRWTTLETYDYVLELDRSGVIIGGEWVGASKRAHPDFLWYSFANSSYSASSDDRFDGDNTALRYSYWKQLHTLATRQNEGGGGGGGTGNLHLEAAPGAAIPDNDATGVASSLEVSESFLAASARLSVEISHSYRGDLRVVLTHDGRSVTVHDRAGGSADDLRSSFELPDLVGREARGRWTLGVVDTARADTGTLVRWSLDLGRPAGGGGGGGGTPVTRDLSATPRLAIPDDDPRGISSALDMTEDLRLDTVRVELDITHPYVGDLRVVLSNGTATQVLHDRAGGSGDDLRRSFDTSAFRNASSRGRWLLSVVDAAGQDVGRLESWRLTFVGTPR